MIYLGADHGGFHLKEKIKFWLKAWGYSFQDLGNKKYDPVDDYPQFAFAVAERVVQEEKSKRSSVWGKRPKGILSCRSSAGVVIAANKVKGSRCAACFDEKSASHAREHNDANILALAADWLSDKEAKKVLKTWLDTEFSGEERHKRRLKEIEQYEQKL